MKKIFLALLFFATTTIALAQVEKQDDRQEVDLDKIQQEPQRPAQIAQERAVRVEAQRLQNEKTATKAAKKKARKSAREKAKQPVVR
jgi:hypothetical protein